MDTLEATGAAKPADGLRAWLAQHPLLGYFVIAFAGMWALVWPMALIPNLPDPIFLILFVLNAFTGPALAAFVVTAAAEGRAGVNDLLRRCVRWRVAPHWYLVALTANLVVWLLAYTAVTGSNLLGAAAAHWPLLLSVFLPRMLLGLIIPSLGEEPGWRGFALPHMQARYGPVPATLLLGFLHGVWHLPALFTPLLGPFTVPGFIAFVLTATFATTIYTWVFNHTRQSVLIAMLIHASSNAASTYLGTLLDQAGVVLPESGWLGTLIAQGWLNVIAYGAVALLLITLTRGRLGYETSDAHLGQKP